MDLEVACTLRKSQHRGGDGREGAYIELELYMGHSGSEECNFLGGSSSVEGLCTRLRKRDIANEHIELHTALLRQALVWSMDVGSVAHNDTGKASWPDIGYHGGRAGVG